jgi:nucleoid-associated protein
MQNNIVNLVVHKLLKDPHGAATIELADAPINATPSAQRLIDHLHNSTLSD